MIITEKELQRRLESTKNLANQPFVPNVLPVAYKQLPIQPFQIPNDSVRLPQERPKLPLETQKVIAGLAAQGVSKKEIAQEFQVSQVEIRQAAKDPAVRSVVERSMERVRELALDKLLVSLGLMTPDKFADADLKTLASTASSLARVIEKTSLQSQEESQKLQFIVYAPKVREASHYKVIDV